MNFNWKEFETVEELEADTEFASLPTASKNKIKASFWIETISEVVEDPRIVEEKAIRKEFQDTINSFVWQYSQAEIDTFDIKVSEAEKVIAGGTSTFLSWLLVEWETLLWLSQLILGRATAYKAGYAQAEKVMREKLKALYS